MFRKLLILVCVSLLLAIGVSAQGDSAPSAAKPAAATTKSAAFRPTKDQIKQGQQMLIDQKLYTGQATGVYGDSRSAIKAYQKANGLEQSGKFDRATLEKMGIALTDKQRGISTPAAASSSDGMISGPSASKSKTTASSKQSAPSDGSAAPVTASGPKRPAPFQATKEQITALQTTLKDAKLFTGEANGERSDALKAAVTKYQEANGLKATGGINAATLQKAGIALTDKQKEQVAAQAAYEAAKPPSKQD